jgi:two-component system NtrC family sensor kinase
MDEATRVRAFDPFFTTKDVGRGTGQGLALAHDVIVNKHGGTISVASAPGKGSTFTLRLPLHPQDAASLPILPAA